MPQNVFYIAANIMFDIRSGDTREILLLVNKQEDATVFNQKDADQYYTFVTMRAQNLTRAPSITWSIERLTLPFLPADQQRFIIKGVQYV